jgi:small GTP-binding protein
MTTAEREIARRRTFAIISHPDAGKTTLTEKFLLYGGAVQLAGSVTSRKNARATTSDWMELEKQRGISVSSTVLQFDYRDCVVNLLDTPGHKDFSEDTYRVLTAVDAAVMVIDAGKGIESQTRKLFEVCRKRGVPIFTFMNKLDRPARPPLELLDELESVLGIHALPMNWPLGDGPEFRGVFDRKEKSVHLFEKTPAGAYRAPVSVAGIQDETVRAALAADVHAKVCDELDLLDGAGTDFDFEAVRAGNATPVFFGSAANNIGVQLLLDNSDHHRIEERVHPLRVLGRAHELHLMIDEFDLTLGLAEVTSDRWLEALGVHVVFEFKSFLVVRVQVFQGGGSTRGCLWRLKVTQLGMLQVANLARVVNVEIELIWVKTESLHIYIITLLVYTLYALRKNTNIIIS